jgi:ribonuclease BN (tRNA processing enzyme)
MNITLLGTGTPAPTPKRAGSSFLVEAAGETFLFDCGPGSHVRMLQAGVAVTSVTQLFLTHFHYDHFADLPHLVLRRWDQGAGRVGELPIYGPRPIKQIIAALFNRNGIFWPDLEARTRNKASVALYRARGGRGPRKKPKPIVTELRHGSIVRKRNWMVRAVETPHTQPQLQSLAYRLDCDEGSFVYSGDTGPCDNLVKLARDADVLLHMCHYVSGTEFNAAMRWGCAGHKLAAEHAKAAAIKTLVLTHITEQVDTTGVRERVIQEVSEIFPGNVVFGEDLKPIYPRSSAIIVRKELAR